MGCWVGSGGGVTWWRERSRNDEWTAKCRRRWREQRESDRYESEREKRGVMRATRRLIQIQRQNSLKRLRDAKRLVQLTVCPTYCPSIPPPSLSLCPLYLHLPGSYNYPPTPCHHVNCTSCCHVNNTPTTCSNIRACILF